MLIEYGGNDCDFDWAAVAKEPGREHLPKTMLSQFGESLKQIAELVRSRGGLPVLCSLPPLHAARYFEWISKGLSKEGIMKYLGEVQSIFHWQQAYSDKVLNAAEELGCAFLPLRDAFVNYTGEEDLMCIDGIHPNAQGHAVMAHQALIALMKLDLGLEMSRAASI